MHAPRSTSRHPTPRHRSTHGFAVVAAVAGLALASTPAEGQLQPLLSMCSSASGDYCISILTWDMQPQSTTPAGVGVGADFSSTFSVFGSAPWNPAGAAFSFQMDLGASSWNGFGTVAQPDPGVFRFGDVDGSAFAGLPTPTEAGPRVLLTNLRFANPGGPIFFERDSWVEVPEPEAVLLVLPGVLAMALLRRRRTASPTAIPTSDSRPS